MHLEGVHMILEPNLDDTDIEDMQPQLQVWATLWEADDTRRSTHVAIPATATDDEIATAFVQAIVGVGAMRGTLLDAIKRRVTGL
jgi:hypothetical protein